MDFSKILGGRVYSPEKVGDGVPTPVLAPHPYLKHSPESQFFLVSLKSTSSIRTYTLKTLV